MAAVLELAKLFSRKRKADEEFLSRQYEMQERMAKKRHLLEMEFETEAFKPAVLSAIVIAKNDDESRSENWWANGYQNWDEASFKKRLRVSRDTFEYILNEISDLITKDPTRMKPNPTPLATQLALCLYRLAHGCTFLTVGDLFGVAESTAHVIFQDVCKAIVGCLHDGLVYLPRNLQEWCHELERFLENWEFPCVGAWNGFHFYVSTKLKNFCSYKKRYSVTNMGFIGHHKRFMWAAVGAPGSTHGSRLLRSCGIYSDIEAGHVLPHRSLNLHPYGEISFITVGDTAFPNHSWLLKPYKEGTRVPKQRYFNRRLCSARVVSEHAYGMLKGRWRILFKKEQIVI